MFIYYLKKESMCLRVEGLFQKRVLMLMFCFSESLGVDGLFY